ncbi:MULTISPECIES: transposase [unclassified Duganella]|uniref:REP-associated tyrosine transposase n=1 Tax=unclassified Duganella TaxID=2636909 RepID=UPI0008831ADF|nr:MULTISPECIES: transposase [unclassified Duganella]SDG81090.1 REP element-mobilizing transposase RayT [Duganella sp. OV458]SDK08396.1 REP element-mobilizing transposase RayT [Duganella sp. OV510]
MSRPLRLEFSGALYHVTSRGDRQQAIYRDDTDRHAWLEVLAQACARFNFTVHSFCQMTNHYHLLIETGEANLSDGMRQLNGQYSQYFNRRHQVVGHVFQGRYTSVLVQKENHLRELARYVVLNPVRAQMVTNVEDWPWSSYKLTIQTAQPPTWLEIDWMLSQFGSSRADAIDAYKRFVIAGIGVSSPLKNVQHQLLLGDDDFMARYRDEPSSELLGDVTREHRRALALPLAEYQHRYTNRDEAIAAAYLSTAYTMKQIADHFGVSDRTVSRIMQKMEHLPTSSCTFGRTDPG